ncbi:MAG: hypothetical protein INQ03_01955 [Candidatus Heimdallarchaeota archaeon]|nr:hypothetical protein [Candidatus Heimdallarchaeota archaeon]
MKEGYFGKYKDPSQPAVRFDPLQSFRDGKELVGFRIHLVGSRRDRPRDQERITDSPKYAAEEESVFFKIRTGESESIPITGDDQIIGNYTDEPKLHKLDEYKGITIINKFAAVNYNAVRDPGVSLVSFSNTYSTHLDNIEASHSIFVSLRTALQEIITKNDRFNTSIIFINIGPTSGASLQQYHAQAYVLSRLHGTLSYAFNKAFEQNIECLHCQLANDYNLIQDHLDQTINIDSLIIWEDEYSRLINPFAPIRPLSFRILIKRHVTWFGELNDAELHSIAEAMAVTHRVLKHILPEGWSRGLDRSIAFRQSKSINHDFHIFIDLLSSIPMGAAEICDYLSITSFIPDEIIKKIREAIQIEFS